jgi:hypothetical protein
MNKDDIRFEIDQLRKDKMIYALESIAVSMAMFLLSSFVSFVFPYLSGFVLIGAIILAVGYWLFTAIGNTKRLVKIRKLERILKK